MDSGAMDKLEELLPGIEDFLVRVLPQEKLSTAAERQRQYFAERLDILKLPPSLPPRAGKRISTELLQETEKTSGIPAELVPEATEIESELEKDFAAKQREISRNLLTSVSSDKEDDDDDTDSSKGVKVYDDIDPTESTKNDEEEEDEDDDDINALYEIPIARQNPAPTSEDSLSQPADVSSLATAGSMDDVNDDVLDMPSPAWQPPPPLPPRKKKSESESRNSVNSLEDRPPELPFRPPLPRRNEIYARSEKSDKSEKSEKSDLSDGDSTSYESFDEEDSELRSKLNIKLPKRPKKKSKASAKLLSSKARSSSTWEINVPFKKLDSVQLSGDLQHRGKLTWNKRLVAIANGCLALYKPDKEGRPVFVLPLAGYQASVGERDGRKGFEIKLTHKDGDTHLLTADFKEWASMWCDHINAAAQGLPIPSYHQHLTRTFSGGSENSAYGSKGNLSNSNSNLSISSDGVESDDSSKPVRMRGNKVMRMGSFAYRATQFFENLGKKSTSKRKSSSLSAPADREMDLHLRDGIQEESSLSSGSLGHLPVSPSSDLSSPVFVDGSLVFPSSLSSPTSSDAMPSPCEVVNNVKHQGYLNIFSSFNKRRWGQRWCLVRENMFECYRTKAAHPCELNFLLKNCVLRQALAETSSPLAIMLLENDKEKITVEPPTKDDLSQWLRVLMVETATQAVPDGLEEFFVDAEDWGSQDPPVEAEYTDIMGASVIKSWEVVSSPILSNAGKGGAEMAGGSQQQEADVASKPDDEAVRIQSAEEAPVSDRYLYTPVVKRPSNSTLEEVFEEEDVAEEEGHAVGAQEGGGDEGGGGGEDGCREDKEERVKKEEKVPQFTDNLAVYNANKNTTDSGFYSVKEAGSDSDSSSELKSEEASPSSPRQETASSSSPLPPPPLPSSSPPTLPPAASPSPPPPALSPSEQVGASPQLCNSSETEISASYSVSEPRRPSEEEEEGGENVLEKTMTPDDFREQLESAGGESTPMSSPVQKRAEIAVEVDDGSGYDGDGRQRDDVVQELVKDVSEEHPSSVRAAQSQDQGQSQGQTEIGEASVPRTAEAEVVDDAPQQKSKKKKKKSKSKKNKQQKQPETVEQERSFSTSGPHREQYGVDSSVQVGATSPTAEKGKHKHSTATVGNRGSTENPNSLNSSVNVTNLQPSSVLKGHACSSSSSSHENSVLSEPKSREESPAKQEVSSTTGEGASASASASASGEGSARVLDGSKAEGPEDNETVSELRERIGRLREKLIQIKRKRIAVRDKRVRAFSAEERAVCDKEYLVLEAECKETSATIQRLEDDLKMAVQALTQS